MLGVIKKVADARLVFGVPDKQIELVLLERLRGESTGVPAADCTTKQCQSPQIGSRKIHASRAWGSARSKAREVLGVSSEALT